MIAKNFSMFINESSEEYNVAGVAVLYEDTILLVHPTNASWKASALGIPKGKIESGEDPMSAAIRELYEETGIKINISDLEIEPLVAPHFDKNGNIVSQLIYFILRIKSTSDIGIDGYVVPKHQLQLEEVDWAGFVKIDDAYPKIHRSQMIILDRLR